MLCDLDIVDISLESFYYLTREHLGVWIVRLVLFQFQSLIKSVPQPGH